MPDRASLSVSASTHNLIRLLADKTDVSMREFLSCSIAYLATLNSSQREAVMKQGSVVANTYAHVFEFIDPDDIDLPITYIDLVQKVLDDESSIQLSFLFDDT